MCQKQQDVNEETLAEEMAEALEQAQAIFKHQVPDCSGQIEVTEEHKRYRHGTFSWYKAECQICQTVTHFGTHDVTVWLDH